MALLAAAAALALVATGCGSDELGTPAGDALKVGLITDLGQLNDNGFNELAYNGLKRAQAELVSRAASSSRSRRPTTSPTWPHSRGTAST